jgi:ABC-type lipoprotein release transport system permease subunit
LRGVPAADPVAVAIAILFAVTFFASAAPAWRASKVDPVITLRHE